MDELSSTVQRRPDRLPSTYRPMADVITGGRRVMLSTDAASRRALRSVGKVAATTHDVIHLDTSATPRRRIDEVIAHELTHVAHPSATPRFFDDVDHSPEERKAEQVAEIIARSPLAPNSPAATRPPAAPSTPSRADTIRRSPAPAASSSTSAESLAATVAASATSSPAGSSSSGPSSAAMLRRAIDRGSAPSPSSPGAQVSATSDQTIQRLAQPSTSRVSESVGADDQADPFDTPDAEEWFLAQIDRHFDRIVDRLEARMIVEFERRGGRTWGEL